MLSYRAMIVLMGTLLGGIAVVGAQVVDSSRIAHLQRGDAYYNSDSLRLAIEEYYRVVYDAKGRAIEDSVSGYALHRMALSADYSGDAAAARTYYRKAIAMRDATFPEPHNDRAKSRLNLGNHYLDSGKIDSAEAYLYAAAELYGTVKKPYPRDYIKVFNSLVRLAYHKEDSQTGRAAARIVDKLLAAYGPTLSPTFRGHIHYNIAQSLAYLDQFDVAVHHAQMALTSYHAAEEAAYIARTYIVLHVIAARQDNYDLALNYLDTAISLAPSEARLDRSHSLHGLARQQIRTGHYSAARGSLRAAEGGLPPNDLLHSHNAKVWGLLHAHTGETERALRSFNRAIELLDTATVAHLDLLALHLTDRADFLATTGRHAAALRDYETVIYTRERLRRDVSSQGSRHRLSADLRPILNRAIDLCYREYEFTGQDSLFWKALQLSEWSRAYDLLRNQTEGPAAGREFDLRLEAARLERASLQGDEEATQQLSEVRLQLDRLVRTRRRGEGAPPLPHLDETELRHFLGDNTLYIYHLGDSTRGYLFTLRRDESLQMRAINTTGLTELVKAWRAATEASAYRRKSLRPTGEQRKLDSLFFRNGRKLTNMLRIEGPDRPWPPGPQRGSGPIRTAIIIPDGILHSLSFAALPLDEDRYLGETTPLTYGYSIATLLAQHAAPPDTITYERDLLALAPSFAPGTLPTLPHAKEEVDYTCGLFANHEKLVDDRANREAFLQSAPHARLLHLSTHGKADLENPGLSHVAFHQNGSTEDADQRLYYNELAAFRLPAELVVLSACETNVGRPARGETVLSLATAFTAAGARSTLTSLWAVDERATQLLLETFYDRLAVGKSRREALYDAQLSLRQSKDYAHPFYWAGFVLHGNASALPEDMAPAAAPALSPSLSRGEGMYHLLLWLTGLILLALAILTFARRKA